MHELSIALSIIELAEEEAERRPDSRITAIHLKLGPLSGVVKDALLGSWEIACAGTALEGSSMRIEEVPIMVHCEACDTDRTIASMSPLCCPVCGKPTPHIVQGKELQVVALEITELEPHL